MLQLSKIWTLCPDCWHNTEDLTNLTEVTNDVGNNSTLLLTHDDSSVQHDIWYLDSGATNHMCGRKNFLLNSQEEFIEVWAWEILQNFPLKAKGRSESIKKMVNLSIFLLFIIFLIWIVIFSVSVNYSKKDTKYIWRTIIFDWKMQKKTGSIVLEQALESKLTLNDRGSQNRGRGHGSGRGRGS